MKISSKSFYLSLIVLVSTIVFVFLIAQRGQPVVIKTNLENLPMQIGGYSATEDFFPDSVYEELNADRHVYRHYRDSNGNQIDLYIGYYGTAKGGRTGHNPYACLPSAGWGIVEAGTAEVRPSYYPNGVKVNYVIASRGIVKNVMYHWYQTAGNRILASGLQQNIQRFKGRILHNRNDGAYVQVNSMTSALDISIIRKMAEGFVVDVMEQLPIYWPEEE
ncbi:EpsI family protein [bacterium]|nr:EpsI family protein [bacterium]